MDNHLQLFCSIGLSEQKARETLKNDKLRYRLSSILNEAAKYGSLSENGMLYYYLAPKVKPVIENHLPFIVKNITGRKIVNNKQVDAALEYFTSYTSEDIDVKAFEEYCGIGIEVTSEEIEQCVEEIIQKHKNEIIDKRYKFNVGAVLEEIRKKLKWADGRIVKNEVDLQVECNFPFFIIDSVNLVHKTTAWVRNY